MPPHRRGPSAPTCTSDCNRHDPLGRAPLLHIEFVLFAARSGRRRPELAKRLRARRALVAEVLAEAGIADPAWGGALLLALEDGFRFHRLIDPASTPADSFVHSLEELRKLAAARG